MSKKVSEWKAELSAERDRSLRITMMLDAVLRGTTLRACGIDADGTCFDLHTRPSLASIEDWAVMLVTDPGTPRASSSVMIWCEFHEVAAHRADHSYGTALDNLYRVAWAYVRKQMEAKAAIGWPVEGDGVGPSFLGPGGSDGDDDRDLNSEGAYGD